MDSNIARRTFEAENNIRTTSKQDDALYYCDREEQENLRMQKPWAQDVHYFKDVHISAVALIKMAMHARSGGNIEVMGSIQGKILPNAFVVLDVFPLPVQGTETRVNASQDANEFLVQYSTECPQVGRKESIIGWYHSHPGYGCWLSGIDVQTQSTHQMYEDPFLAIVIDPIRTISSGKIDLGAFRTYPSQYTSDNNKNNTSTGYNNSEYQTIPINKIEDFGVHCKSYYQLNIKYFQSKLDANLLDLLWNKYWARSLSTSPLIQNKHYVIQQLNDIGRKINQIDLSQFDKNSSSSNSSHHSRSGYYLEKKSSLNQLNGGNRKDGGQFDQISKDAQKCCGEHLHSVMSMYIKNSLFTSSSTPAVDTTVGSDPSAPSTLPDISNCRPQMES